MQNWPLVHMQVFSKPLCLVSINYTHKHTNKAGSAQENLGSKILIVGFIDGVYICVCICMCGSGEAQLPQLSTLALALKSDGPLLPACPWTPCSPAHCSLEPKTLQMIYYPHTERRLSPNLSSPPSQSFSPSSLFTPLTCQPYYFLTLSLSKRKIHSQSSVLTLILSWTHLYLIFFIGKFSCPSYLCCLVPFLSVLALEHRDCVLLVILFSFSA